MRPCGFTACFTPKHKGWWCLLHCGIYPIESMYAIFTYIWLMFIVNVWYIFDVTYNTLYIYIPYMDLYHHSSVYTGSFSASNKLWVSSPKRFVFFRVWKRRPVFPREASARIWSLVVQQSHVLQRVTWVGNTLVFQILWSYKRPMAKRLKLFGNTYI